MPKEKIENPIQSEMDLQISSFWGQREPVFVNDSCFTSVQPKMQIPINFGFCVRVKSRSLFHTDSWDCLVYPAKVDSHSVAFCDAKKKKWNVNWWLGLNKANMKRTIFLVAVVLMIFMLCAVLEMMEHTGQWECSHSNSSNIKGYARKCTSASCVNWALGPVWERSQKMKRHGCVAHDCARCVLGFFLSRPVHTNHALTIRDEHLSGEAIHSPILCSIQNYILVWCEWAFKRESNEKKPHKCEQALEPSETSKSRCFQIWFVLDSQNPQLQNGLCSHSCSCTRLMLAKRPYWLVLQFSNTPTGGWFENELSRSNRGFNPNAPSRAWREGRPAFYKGENFMHFLSLK